MQTVINIFALIGLVDSLALCSILVIAALRRRRHRALALPRRLIAENLHRI